MYKRQALTYARCRYTYADGDYTRMRHQRQVLGALANQILNNLSLIHICTYSRVRQASITTEINEIVGGASALEEQ